MRFLCNTAEGGVLALGLIPKKGIVFVFALVFVFVFVFVRKQTEGSKATSEGLVLFPQRDQVLTKDEN